MGSDYPRGTYENVVYHFHGTIQIIILSYLRPVVWDYRGGGFVVTFTISLKVNHYLYIDPNIHKD